MVCFAFEAPRTKILSVRVGFTRKVFLVNVSCLSVCYHSLCFLLGRFSFHSFYFTSLPRLVLLMLICRSVLAIFLHSRPPPHHSPSTAPFAFYFLSSPAASLTHPSCSASGHCQCPVQWSGKVPSEGESGSWTCHINARTGLNSSPLSFSSHPLHVALCLEFRGWAI